MIHFDALLPFFFSLTLRRISSHCRTGETGRDDTAKQEEEEADWPLPPGRIGWRRRRQGGGKRYKGKGPTCRNTHAHEGGYTSKTPSHESSTVQYVVKYVSSRRLIPYIPPAPAGDTAVCTCAKDPSPLPWPRF